MYNPIEFLDPVSGDPVMLCGKKLGGIDTCIDGILTASCYHCGDYYYKWNRPTGSDRGRNAPFQSYIVDGIRLGTVSRFTTSDCSGTPDATAEVAIDVTVDDDITGFWLVFAADFDDGTRVKLFASDFIPFSVFDCDAPLTPYTASNTLLGPSCGGDTVVSIGAGGVVQIGLCVPSDECDAPTCDGILAFNPMSNDLFTPPPDYLAAAGDCGYIGDSGASVSYRGLVPSGTIDCTGPLGKHYLISTHLKATCIATMDGTESRWALAAVAHKDFGDRGKTIFMGAQATPNVAPHEADFDGVTLCCASAPSNTGCEDAADGYRLDFSVTLEDGSSFTGSVLVSRIGDGLCSYQSVLILDNPDFTYLTGTLARDTGEGAGWRANVSFTVAATGRSFQAYWYATCDYNPAGPPSDNWFSATDLGRSLRVL